MGTILLVLALICFVVETFGGSIFGLNLIALGLAFWVAASLVGSINITKR